MTINDTQKFKQMINQDFGILILSTYSATNKAGQFAERMEFLTVKDMEEVYPQLLLFCADNKGIILHTSLKSKSVTLLVWREN